jgi:hypothetical protein
MQIVFGILYVLAGFLLAIPYCMLAGWNEESFPMAILVSPAFLFVWFMLSIFAGIFDLDSKKAIRLNWRAAFKKSDLPILPGFLPLFWAWTIYMFLPIIFHWSAILLEKIGCNTVASFIDTHRYASQLYLFVVALALLVLISVGISAWDAAKRTWIRIRHS